MFFELQDVRRRHNPTWWTNNTTAWVTPPDSTLSWNYQRGLMIGLVVGPLQTYLTHFIYHASAMLKHYETPIGAKQWLTFVKETRRLESFTSGLKSRYQQGAAVGALSIAPQVALYRLFNSGWGTVWGAVDYSAYRKFPTTFAAFAVCSPLSVLVDMVSRAYYADRTFPKQLQKGYKSWFDAFKRIPFEQGPYYLFKNTLPHYLKHTFGPFTCFYTYDWVLDKLSVIPRSGPFPQLPLKIFSALVSVWTAAVITFPYAYTVREMVDFWPKKDGVDPFQGNYRKAAVWMFYSETLGNFYLGMYKKYLWHIGPQWFLSLLLADKMGMFRKWKIDIFSGAGDNSNEDSFV